MDTKSERRRTLEELDGWLQNPMLALSLIWLVLLIIELTRGLSDFLEWFGTVIWIVFILEFALRFTLAPEKRPFLRTNWLTIIALAVPALRLFRAFAFLRAARALRGVRLVRVVGTANRGMKALRKTLKRRQFGYVFALTALVLFLGAAGMLSFERAHEGSSGLTSYGHALWWTGMLIASIGTDFWPTSPEGRILSSLLSLYGLAVFGYVTATFASFFIGRDAGASEDDVASVSDLTRLRQEITALRHLLEAGHLPSASGTSKLGPGGM